MTDARFEDGADTPLRLIAQDAGDLPPLSALLQDAVFTAADIGYEAKRRRFALLLTRFRWEDAAAAEAGMRSYERVRSLLLIEDVLALRSAGFDRSAPKSAHALLSLSFAAKDDLGGILTLVLAGGGAIALDLEALHITLCDVTRPHAARARPHHGS